LTGTACIGDVYGVWVLPGVIWSGIWCYLGCYGQGFGVTWGVMVRNLVLPGFLL